MHRPAALLLVFVLTGTPAAAVLCLSSCDPLAEAPRVTCHEHEGASSDETILTDFHRCDPTLLEATVSLTPQPSRDGLLHAEALPSSFELPALTLRIAASRHGIGPVPAQQASHVVLRI